MTRLGDLGVAAPSATSPSTSTSRALSPAGSAWRGTTGAWPAAASTAPTASGSAPCGPRRAPPLLGGHAAGAAGAGSSPGRRRRPPARAGMGARRGCSRGGSRRRRAARGASRPWAPATPAAPTRPGSARSGRQPDLLPLVPVQAARLLPDHVGDGHPADVVQQPGHLEVGHGRRQPQPLPGAAGQGGHAGPWVNGVFRSARSAKTAATSASRSSGTVTGLPPAPGPGPPR